MLFSGDIYIDIYLNIYMWEHRHTSAKNDKNISLLHIAPNSVENAVGKSILQINVNIDKSKDTVNEKKLFGLSSSKNIAKFKISSDFC